MCTLILSSFYMIFWQMVMETCMLIELFPFKTFRKHLRNVTASQLVETTHRNKNFIIGFCLVQVGRTFRFAPLEHHMYPFVSVVEQFSMVVKWSLHCLLKSEIKKNGDIGGVAGSGLVQWFCISDSQVLSVSERGSCC